MLLYRILLAVLLLLGVAGCAFTQFLDMTLLNTVHYTELGAESITDDRRQELVAGLRNLGNMQLKMIAYAWLTALGTTVMAGTGLMLTFRKPKP